MGKQSLRTTAQRGAMRRRFAVLRALALDSAYDPVRRRRVRVGKMFYGCGPQGAIETQPCGGDSE